MSERIAIIDASPETRRALESQLGRTGRVLTFVAAEAAEAERLQKHHLWLIEVRTSDEDACRLVARGQRRAQVLLLARAEQAEDIAKLTAAGAQDVILLPINPAELALRVTLHRRDETPTLTVRRDERALRVLLELTQALASTLDFQDILYTLVRRIAEVVRVDRVSIVLVPDEPNVGFVVAASDDARLSNLRLDLHKYPEIQHVLSTKQSLTIDDVATHPVLDDVRESVQDARLRTLSLLPIIWEEEIMGVLFIRGEGPRPLDHRQLGFCQVLANATAIALRNARVLQALRDETQRDTYARMEAERRLQSLKHYADLFVSAVDGVVAFDASGSLLFANPAAYALLGSTGTQVPLGTKLRECIAPTDHRFLDDLRAGFAAGHFPRNVDLKTLRPDGTVSIINGSFSPVRGTEGAVLMSFRDVTEERRTQGELAKTKRFLQSMIEASVDAIVASDMQGKIILFNDGAYRLYGYRPEEAVGKLYVHSLYPGDGAREVGRMLRSEAHGGVGRLEPVRMEAVDVHGQVVPISLTAATIYENGVPTANFGIFSDLREQTRVEQALAQAQEKLAVSEKQALVVELAGATAHELNQPLTSIMGCSELLHRQLPSGDPLRKTARKMQQEVERMAEIVRKIGDLTKYETKSYVGRQKILDLDGGSDAPQHREGSA